MRDILSFLGKFLLFSTIMLGIWLISSETYLKFLVSTSKIGLSAMGYEITRSELTYPDSLMQERVIWYYCRGRKLGLGLASTYSFSVIPFIGLMLATSGIELRKRLKLIVIGLAVLFFLDLANILFLASWVLSHQSGPEPPFLIRKAFRIISLFSPFILWILLTQGNLIKPTENKG